MPSQNKTGRTKKHRVGFIAVGYSVFNDFWYSSEGVFSTAKDAIEDLNHLYEVDLSYAVKIGLKKPKRET